MDNPDPLAHLDGVDGESSEEEDDEVWNMDPNFVSRTDVYGTQSLSNPNTAFADELTNHRPLELIRDIKGKCMSAYSNQKFEQRKRN